MLVVDDQAGLVRRVGREPLLGRRLAVGGRQEVDSDDGVVESAPGRLGVDGEVERWVRVDFLPSVDLDTVEARPSQYERSDVTALPAAGVIAEAMVALVLADALLEKLGGDSLAELRAHWR